MIPDIYKEYRDSVPFNIGKFFFIFLSAFLYSIIVYFIPSFVFKYGYQDDSGRVRIKELNYHVIIVILDLFLF